MDQITMAVELDFLQGILLNALGVAVLSWIDTMEEHMGDYGKQQRLSASRKTS